MGTFFTEDLLLELSGSSASNIWEEKVLEERLSFFLPIKNVDQTSKFFTRKKGTLLKEECDIFRGLRAREGIADLVPLCYCVFVVIGS